MNFRQDLLPNDFGIYILSTQFEKLVTLLAISLASMYSLKTGIKNILNQ